MDNTKCVIKEKNPTTRLKNLLVALSPKTIYKPKVFYF